MQQKTSTRIAIIVVIMMAGLLFQFQEPLMLIKQALLPKRLHVGGIIILVSKLSVFHGRRSSSHGILFAGSILC